MSSRTDAFVSWVARYWLWFLIPAILVFVAPILMPGPIYYWSYSGFKTLFYNDLGFSAAWSSIWALACGFIYAAALPLTLRWFIFGSWWIGRRWGRRKWFYAFLFSLIAFGTTPVLHVVFESGPGCKFNQSTGEPLTYYAIRPGGDIALSDSPGVDPPSGIKRQPCTPEMAWTVKRYLKGDRPQRITGDPRQLTFFDSITGHPRVWYYRTVDEQYELFTAEGLSPDGGVLLPVTNEVVSAIKQRADAEQTQAQAAAKEEARKQLVELFGVESYAPGVVIVGARAREPNDGVSTQAAKQLLADIIASLRKKGVAADELQPKVYDSAYFDALMRGDSAVLADVGLAKKMRAAVLALVDVTCQKTASVSDLTSCTVVAHLRILKSGSSNASSSEWSETGAGTNREDAIARATELLIERHPGLLDGA